MKSNIPKIHFFYEDTTFQLVNEESYSSWIYTLIEHYEASFKEINYIFCSDEYLLKINQDYLNHDYYTDIITFCNSKDPISTDIFISIDRVKENAKQLEESFEHESLRVMAHGLLHLIGYDDKTEEDKQIMSTEESKCVSLYI